MELTRREYINQAVLNFDYQSVGLIYPRIYTLLISSSSLIMHASYDYFLFEIKVCLWYTVGKDYFLQKNMVVSWLKGSHLQWRHTPYGEATGHLYLFLFWTLHNLRFSSKIKDRKYPGAFNSFLIQLYPFHQKICTTAMLPYCEILIT